MAQACVVRALDSNGQFTGGDVLFIVNGCGIETTAVVTIPGGVRGYTRFAPRRRWEEHITVDGETVHNEDEEHESGRAEE